MSARKLAEKQPASFAFSDDMLALAKRIIAKYPEGRQASAVIPLLDLAQRQEGWTTRPAIEVIAKMLDMPSIRVLEVATFYTMFNLHPVGKAHVQVCTSLPCQLRGSDDVVRACKDKLGIGLGETSADGKYTLGEVECAGACVNAPVFQIGDDYYEDADYANTSKVLDTLKSGGALPKSGSLTGRDGSAPKGSPITLNDNPQPAQKQDFAAAKAAFEKAKAEAAAKAAAPKA